MLQHCFKMYVNRPLTTNVLTVSGVFSLGVPVDDLFFIGNQLVATSHTGKVGVWNAVTQHWQVGRVGGSVCVCGDFSSGFIFISDTTNQH